LLKVISGGQTGVDRGALDAALALEVECGGWCPAGRLAEDGTIPEHYPVVQLANAGYAERTARNVADSDGTLVISNGEPIGGTRETIQRCVELDKPHLVIDHPLVATNENVEQVLGLVGNHRIHVLNVAGPRASQWPDGHQIAEQIVSGVLRRLSGQNDANEYSS
jgi:putative molybdenum carrier protein